MSDDTLTTLEEHALKWVLLCHKVGANPADSVLDVIAAGKRTTK